MKNVSGSILFLLPIAFLPSLAVCQNPQIRLTYSAIDDTSWVRLDSIRIINRTRQCDTMLYYPDTVLYRWGVGIGELHEAFSDLAVFQNYPNPASGQTVIHLFIPERDDVEIIVTDLAGRQAIRKNFSLEKGDHSFRFFPGNEPVYIFTATWRGRRKSIRILHDQSVTDRMDLVYTGRIPSFPVVKKMSDSTVFRFTPGDQLLNVGFRNGVETGIPAAPVDPSTFYFQFASNMPCHGIPTVDYGGQIYHTIQIYSQCWLKENLNIGIRIPEGKEQTDNDTIEKYCYADLLNSCKNYGGLYQWGEMMQYANTEGAQGICPPGWRIPTNEEWKILEGTADSQYGIGDPIWDTYFYARGYDDGAVLKATSAWQSNTGIDLLGFRALPAGECYILHDGLLTFAAFWTSSKAGIHAWYHYLEDGNANSGLGVDERWFGKSVRCIKN